MLTCLVAYGVFAMHYHSTLCDHPRCIRLNPTEWAAWMAPGNIPWNSIEDVAIDSHRRCTAYKQLVS